MGEEKSQRGFLWSSYPIRGSGTVASIADFFLVCKRTFRPRFFFKFLGTTFVLRFLLNSRLMEFQEVFKPYQCKVQQKEPYLEMGRCLGCLDRKTWSYNNMNINFYTKSGLLGGRFICRRGSSF